MRASALANRSMTVPQGYLIGAVLETAFDSTKPGFARAIVSRDVRGFDGKNVLIPRGSRLIGEYKSAAGQGQNRAVISWTRLIRPDGMTIEMDAPAVDTVGLMTALRILCALVAFIAAPALGLAQQTESRITGRVVDQSQGTLDG